MNEQYNHQLAVDVTPVTQRETTGKPPGYTWRKEVHHASKRLFNIPEAAVYLGRSEWGVRRLIWNGKLPQVRCGKRVHLDLHDMETFIESNKTVD